MLLNSLVIAIVVIVAFAAVICVAEREWGTLIFAIVMLGGMALLMIYGPDHIPVG